MKTKLNVTTLEAIFKAIQLCPDIVPIIDGCYVLQLTPKHLEKEELYTSGYYMVKGKKFSNEKQSWEDFADIFCCKADAEKAVVKYNQDDYLDDIELLKLVKEK